MKLILKSKKEKDTMSFGIAKGSDVHKAIKERSEKMGEKDKEGNITLNAWQLWCSLSESKTKEYKSVKKWLRRHVGNHRFTLHWE